MAKRRILLDEIGIGSILPWNVFDERGHLLLTKGHVVSSDTQIDRLIQHGLFAEAEPEPEAAQPPRPPAGRSAVGPILEARRRLETLCTGEAGHDRFPERILQIRAMIEEACAVNTDAALATVIFQREGRYSIRHSLDVAVTCHVVGRALELDSGTLTSTVAAALTMNISMLDLQDTLLAQQEPLTPEQREAIHQHPAKSTAMLRALGVSDPVWLDSVLSHHETIDGSGYGTGRKGDEIPLTAQLVSLSDVYCARISGRKYRRPLRTNSALRALFLDQGKKVSAELATRFIKAIGVFPAGTAVRLENGEIAVVTARGEKSSAPHVLSILGPHGMPFVKPVQRDTSQPECRVREVLEWKDVGAMPSMHALWGKLAALN